MSIGLLSFCSFLTGMGSCSAFSAAIKTGTYHPQHHSRPPTNRPKATFNWPENRGTATAFPLSGFGLSAFFFATLASLAFGDSVGDFLLLLAVGTLCLNAASFFFMRLIPTTPAYAAAVTREARPRLSRSNLSKLRRTKSADGDRPPTPGTQPHARGRQGHELTATSARGESADEHSSLVSKASTASSDDDHLPHPTPQRLEITGLAIVRTVEFWQLFILLALLAGVGLMTIKSAPPPFAPSPLPQLTRPFLPSNIGNDAAALWLSHDPNTPDTFLQSREQAHVSILSLASFAGRLLSGVGSDLLLTRLRASRFWCLVASALLFSAAQAAALLITRPHWLFLVSGLTGLAYGALFGVFPALTADAFGVHGLSLNWGFMIFAPVLSGNVYNLAYGAVYDARSRGAEEGEARCLAGRECYAAAYRITLASSVAGVVMALWCVRHEAVKKRRLAARRRDSNAYVG